MTRLRAAVRQSGCHRQPATPFQRYIEIRCRDYGESANVLFAFDIGSIGMQRHAISCVDHCCGGWRVQSAAEDPGACGFHFLAQGTHVAAVFAANLADRY
jgi:hypothetical protein